jgi:SAM-dependent methyltransferase
MAEEAEELVAAKSVELSVVIVAQHEASHLRALLPRLADVLGSLDVSHEVIVVDRDPDERTGRVADDWGARVVRRPAAGYGKALAAGFNTARGTYVLTMDGDASHPLGLIRTMWARRDEAEIVMASPESKGWRSRAQLTSRALNAIFRRMLSLNVRYTASGFRLYRAEALTQLALHNSHLDILREILVKAHCEGWDVLEIPFEYEASEYGRSHGRIATLDRDYLRALLALYRLRNSILCADYDARAHDSIIPPQRYWQRERFRHVTELIAGEGRTLDVGAGSSRIIGALAAGSVALDILLRKLRYARCYEAGLVQGSGFGLPFGRASFPCVICSQVIEHVPKSAPILDELDRVLAPGGALVLGTPDYGQWQWIVIEAIYDRVLPSAYADEHISHYTRAELLGLFEERGYALEAERMILQGELILKLRKPGR